VLLGFASQSLKDFESFEGPSERGLPLDVLEVGAVG